MYRAKRAQFLESCLYGIIPSSKKGDTIAVLDQKSSQIEDEEVPPAKSLVSWWIERVRYKANQCYMRDYRFITHEIILSYSN